MAEFGRILENYPDSEFAAAAQFTFGDYAYNRQEYSEALNAYQKVQEAYPDAPVAAQVPRLLDELKEAQDGDTSTATQLLDLPPELRYLVPPEPPSDDGA